MSLNYVSVLVISAAMLVLSAVMYGIVVRQRESDLRRYLDFYREIDTRIRVLEGKPRAAVVRPEIEVTELEVMVDPTPTVEIPRVAPKAKPEVEVVSTDEVTVIIDPQWQEQQDRLYREAMDAIEQMSVRMQ